MVHVSRLVSRFLDAILLFREPSFVVFSGSFSNLRCAVGTQRKEIVQMTSTQETMKSRAFGLSS